MQHGRVRGGCIPAQDRFHDSVMLRMRTRQAARRAKLRAAIGRQAAAQPERDVRNDRVVTAGIDGAVESDIGFGVARMIVLAHILGHLLVQRAQATALDGCHADGGQTRAGGFDLAHGDEDFLKPLGGDDRDGGATPGARFNQSGRAKLPQRLADGRARYLVAIGESLFVELRARLELARKDGVGDIAGEFFRPGLRAGIGHGLSRRPA